MTESASAIVARLLAACGRRDLEQVASMLTDDVVYDNIPIGAVHGPNAVRSVLGSGITDAADEVEWRVVRQVAEADTVMSERVDRFRIGSRWLEIPVVGVFEVREGRIALWRDYFDLESYRRQKKDLLG
jgi:limonene-1,2-epoxide hydrolase